MKPEHKFLLRLALFVLLIIYFFFNGIFEEKDVIIAVILMIVVFAGLSAQYKLDKKR